MSQPATKERAIERVITRTLFEPCREGECTDCTERRIMDDGRLAICSCECHPEQNKEEERKSQHPRSEMNGRVPQNVITPRYGID